MQIFNKEEGHDPSLGYAPVVDEKTTTCWTAYDLVINYLTERYYRVWITLSVGLSFFSLGMCYACFGIIIVELKHEIDLKNEEESSWIPLVFLFMARSLGSLVGYAGCSIALSKFSFATFRSNCFFIAIVATALATVPLLDSLWKYLVMVFIGLGTGWVEACGNTMLIGLFGDKVDIFMQSCHMAYGVGATGVPILIQQTRDITLSFNWAIWAIAVTVALTGLISLIASFGDVPDDDFQTLHPQAFQDPQGPRRTNFVPPSIRNRPPEHTVLIVVSSLLLFIFSMLHESMGTWWFSYATGASPIPTPNGKWHITPSTACMLMSSYWGSFTLARVLVKLQLYLTPSLYLLVIYTAGAVFVGVLIFTESWSTLILWILTNVVGFFNSGVFSSAVSLPGEMFIWVHHRDAMAFHGMTSLGEIVGPILFGLLFFLVGSGAVKWFLGGIFVIGQLLVMLTLLYANCSPLAQHVKKMKEPGSTFDLEDHPNIGYAPINVDITY